MWPFTRKKKTSSGLLLDDAMETLAALGISLRPGVTLEDVCYSLGTRPEAPVDPEMLVSILGGETEDDRPRWFSDGLFALDYECIEMTGSYAALVSRFTAMAEGCLPLQSLRDRVDLDHEEAWVRFQLEGQEFHWDLEVKDDWADPALFARLQELVTPRGQGRRFCYSDSGQGALVAFADEAKKEALTQFCGRKFVWTSPLHKKGRGL